MPVSLRLVRADLDEEIYLLKQQSPHTKFSIINYGSIFSKEWSELSSYELKVDNDGPPNNMAQYFASVEENKISDDDDDDDDDLKQDLNDKIFQEPAEKFLLEQTRLLSAHIHQHLVNYPEDFNLDAVDILYDKNRLYKFMDDQKFKEAQLMFHGTDKNVLQPIFKDGFWKGGGSVYGRGYYWTPQPTHAIKYLVLYKDRNKKEQDDCFTLIAAFVIKGKVLTIKDDNLHKYSQKPMDPNYDSQTATTMSNYTTKDLGYLPPQNYKGETAEEYAIKKQDSFLPRFDITLKRAYHIFIWRDKKVHNHFNGSALEQLQKITHEGEAVIYGVTTNDVAVHLIKTKMRRTKGLAGNKVYVITNGADDGEGFVKTVRDTLGLRTEILVFCNAVSWHSKWASKYENVSVKCGKKYIVDFVTKHLND